MAWYGRDYNRGMNRGWSGFQGGGYRMRGYDRGWNDRGWNDRDRVTFSPRGHPAYGGRYDRDMGDQLREGWHDLKRGVRRAFGGGGYDRGYHGGRGNYGYSRDRGGYSGYGRGYDRGWF